MTPILYIENPKEFTENTKVNFSEAIGYKSNIQNQLYNISVQ